MIASNIASLLSQTAQAMPQKVFLLADDERLTFGEVEQQACKVASALDMLGVRPGDVVALLLPNSPWFVTAIFGIWKLGAVAAPLNVASPAPELTHQLNDLAAVAVIATGATAPTVVEAVAAANHAQLLWTDPSPAATVGRQPHDWMAGADTAHPSHPTRSDDVALLLSTSGTTGRPKAVQLTHGNLRFIAEVLVQDFWRLTGDDVLLMAVPGYNIFGQTVLLPATLVGATLSLLSRVTPQTFLQTLARDRVTFFAGVPSLAQMMLQTPQAAGADLSALRRVLLAGTALPAELATAFSQRFHAEVITGYGSTEGVPLAFVADLSQAPVGSVGRPTRATRLRIVDEMGQDLPPGRKGEVLAQGPQVFTGYHSAPELTQAAFVDGWYRTGDVGYLDENGFLFLVDRLKDIIKTAGYTVYPAEVEAALAEHPAVAMSAVVGLAHEGVGEVVQAFVVLKPGGTATDRELISHCKACLATYKCPRRIEFCDSLPLTPTGKVLKRALG